MDPSHKIGGSIPPPATIIKTPAPIGEGWEGERYTQQKKGAFMQIGSGFSGQTEKEKKQYISLSFDKGLIALCPFLKNVKLTLWYVPKEDRKKENSPQWRLSMDEPYKPQEQTSSNSEVPADEEIPF